MKQTAKSRRADGGIRHLEENIVATLSGGPGSSFEKVLRRARSRPLSSTGGNGRATGRRAEVTPETHMTESSGSLERPGSLEWLHGRASFNARKVMSFLRSLESLAGIEAGFIAAYRLGQIEACIEWTERTRSPGRGKAMTGGAVDETGSNRASRNEGAGPEPVPVEEIEAVMLKLGVRLSSPTTHGALRTAALLVAIHLGRPDDARAIQKTLTATRTTRAQRPRSVR